MNGYLLDTNALSEAPKPKPDVGFIDWLKDANEETLFTSCLVLGEIKKGINLVGITKRKMLSGWLTKLVADFDNRIVNIDTETSLIWGRLLAEAQKDGRAMQVIDALISAQCIQNGLVLVTRNIKDFSAVKDLRVLCPWTKL